MRLAIGALVLAMTVVGCGGVDEPGDTGGDSMNLCASDTTCETPDTVTMCNNAAGNHALQCNRPCAICKVAAAPLPRCWLNKKPETWGGPWVPAVCVAACDQCQ